MMSTPEQNSDLTPKGAAKGTWWKLAVLVIAVGGAIYLWFPRSSDKARTLPDFDRRKALADLPPAQITTTTVVEVLPDASAEELESIQAETSSRDWPNWRGPGYANAATQWQGPPKWTLEDNLIWRQPIFGRGYSTPIVVGDRIYLTTAEGDTLWLLALDKDSGVEKWRGKVFHGELPVGHQRTSQAASSPVSDGRRIYVAWAGDHACHLAAFDKKGNPVWKTKLGDFAAQHGYASSPAYCDGLVIINCDNNANGYVVAVRADSGEVYWRRKRPMSSEGSYSSPIVNDEGARPQVIVSGLGTTQAFDLLTGAIPWAVSAPSTVVATTPSILKNQVISASGYPERQLVAINFSNESSQSPEYESSLKELYGETTVRGAPISWSSDRHSEVPYVPSPLCFEDKVFLLHDDGVAVCLSADSGKTLWKRRLGGNFSASPVLVNDWILCVSSYGKVMLLDSKNRGEIVHETELPAGMESSPVPCGDRLYLRTTEELLCIGSKGK